MFVVECFVVVETALDRGDPGLCIRSVLRGMLFGLVGVALGLRRRHASCMRGFSLRVCKMWMSGVRCRSCWMEGEKFEEIWPQAHTRVRKPLRLSTGLGE